jgi:hypothetical protein
VTVSELMTVVLVGLLVGLLTPDGLVVVLLMPDGAVVVLLTTDGIVVVDVPVGEMMPESVEVSVTVGEVVVGVVVVTLIDVTRVVVVRVDELLSLDGLTLSSDDAKVVVVIVVVDVGGFVGTDGVVDVLLPVTG